jgi:hypothetical protein
MGEIGDKKMFLDSAFAEKEEGAFLSLNEKCHNIRHNLKSALFSREGITESFFTEDSKLYITPREQELLEKGIEINTRKTRFDGISARVVNSYRYFRPSEKDILYERLLNRWDRMQSEVMEAPQNFLRQISLAKLWNVSIVCAIIVGMVSMTFIYRYLGMGASAKGNKKPADDAPATQVLGSEDIKSDQQTVKYIQDAIDELNRSKQEEFENQMAKMVKGYPIEKMLPYIGEKDRTVAAFLIGIAKKESGWGEHVPVLDGKDCYNYWGYRGQRKRMGTGGHTCFDSPKDAVDTVAKRLQFLIDNKKLDTPAKMVIWKCGSACSKDDQAAVRKWISDVDLYFGKLN